MAGRVIKGITIAIGGDTSGLTKSLDGVDNDLKRTQNELQEVEKALKFNPGNTELLSQQQELLAEKAELTSKRLELLKENEEKVKKAFANNSEYQKAYKPLKQEIDDTKEKITYLSTEEKRLKSQLENGKISADAYDKVKKSLDETKGHLKSLREEKKALDTSFSEGHIDGSQFRAFQREIITTESKLSSYREKLSDINDSHDSADKSLEKLDAEMKNVRQSTEKTSDGYTMMKDVLADLVVSGINKAVDSLEEMAVANDNAIRQFQAQTGSTAEEMSEFNKQMDELYSSGYGNGLEDIANQMAVIKQNAKETDPEKISELTKKAMVLDDTFGFDVNETMRAANMLIDQFGVTGEEAFNLIAQGAQNGLNKNGDLLDSINEYAVHYKQLNYTAEEFFNSLENGTAAGTFSVDKLGDAMKEFGIRTKDTSTTTSEGFELIGLDADKMRTAFAKGGESAEQATRTTLKALFNLDNEVKRNQAGVDLFGTMWEDLGIEGVKALTDVSGSANKTADTIAELEKLDMGSTQKQIEIFSRKLKSDILKPLVDDILPTAEKGIDWASDNLPLIEKGIKLIGIAWGATKLADGVSKTIDMFDGLKQKINSVTESAGKSSNALVKAFGSGGAYIAAAAAAGELLAGAIDSATEKIDEVGDKYEGLTQQQRDFVDAIDASSLAISEHIKDRKSDLSGIDDTAESYRDTADALYELDKQETLSAGDKQTMLAMANSLNSGIEGLNITIDEETGHLKTQKATIDKYIDSLEKKQKLEMLEQDLPEMISDHKKAVEAQAEALEKYNKALSDRDVIKQQITDLERWNKLANSSSLTDKQTKEYKKLDSQIRSYVENCGGYQSALDNLNVQLDKQGNVIGATAESYTQSMETLRELEDLMSGLGVTGVDYVTQTTNFANISKAAFEEMASATKTAFEDVKESFKGVVDVTYTVGDNIYTVSKQTADGIKNIQAAYRETVQQTTDDLYNSLNLFDEFPQKADISAQQLIDNMQDNLTGIQQWGDDMQYLVDQGVSEGLISYLRDMGYDSASYVQAMRDMTGPELQKYSDDFDSAYGAVENSAEQSLGNAKKVCAEQIQGLIEQTDGQKVKLEDAYDILGGYCGTGFIAGIEKSTSEVETAMEVMADKAYRRAKKALRIESPSKLFRGLAQYVPQGAALGIEDTTPLVEQAAQDMADRAASAASESFSEPIKFGFDDNGKSNSGVKPFDFKSTSQLQSTSNGMLSNGANFPKSATFVFNVDGRTLAKIEAPYLDIINGASFRLAERGITNVGNYY